MLFKKLNFSNLLLAAATIAVILSGVLFDYGSRCELLPLVLNGSIRVFKRSENGREISLYRVNADQMCLVTLGCLLGGNDYEAVGVSETDVRAIGIPQGLFIELMAEQPAFRDRIFLFFTERLAGLMNLVEEITFNKLDQRLADVLLKHGPVIDISLGAAHTGT